MFDKLQQDENNVLKKIAKANYCNPYDEFADALETGDNKRYLKDLKIVQYSDIDENQVSINVIFTKRCMEELLPLIEMEGLKNPPLVEESAVTGKYKQVTGHHRAYTMDHLEGAVPVIVVTKNYNSKGNPVSPDIDLIQGIRANPPQTNRAYTLEDAAYMILESLKKNPTQDGQNPNGKLPPRHDADGYDFNDLFNRIYGPYYFPHKATRTKIYNRVNSAGSSSKLIQVSDQSQTSILVQLGWETGIKPSTGKRKSADEHFDSKRNCMIILSDDNGRHFDEKLMSLIKKYFMDKDFKSNLVKNKIKYIDILAKIYRPPSDQASLDGKRNAFKKLVKDWNVLLQKMNVDLKIRELVFQKQLASSGDKLQRFTKI